MALIEYKRPAIYVKIGMSKNVKKFRQSYKLYPKSQEKLVGGIRSWKTNGYRSENPKIYLPSRLNSAIAIRYWNVATEFYT